MFARYAGSKSVFGTIKMVQTAMNKSLEVDTTLAFERPSLFYLLQHQADDKFPDEAIISDGIQVAYSKTPTAFSSVPRIIESVHPKGEPELTTTDFYKFIAVGQPLGKKTLPLNVAVGAKNDLMYTKYQLLTFTLSGKETVDGRDAYRIDGDWADEPTHPKEGTFSMWSTPDGDLVQFANKMSFAVPAAYLKQQRLPLSAFPNGIVVDTVWSVSLTVDQPVNHNLFQLAKP